ncbi:MAG: putative arabinose efflux permease, family [Rhodospirillales bacterium]|jgi:EmrB/QacA subfamily drug resistance transporter|nr:putative arabinose efflux permease, family [Rhodospirillales bacterium]MDB5381663.1 putative arabinose efflux permease, family [Rhodospirillales bacterium]
MDSFPTQPEAVEARRRAFLMGFPAIALAIFLAAVDQTVTSTALPAIAAEFSAVERVSWVVVAYLVAGTCAAPVFGQLGDAYGRRNILYLALGMNLAGCLANAVAPTFPVLIAGRVVQGIGGGGLLTLAMAIIGECLPPRERGRFQGHIASIFASAAAFGPVGGGYLTEHFGWRSIFLVAPPLAVLAGVLALRLARVPPTREHPLRFDWLGLGLFILAVASALIALDQARRMDAALAPLAVGLGVVAVTALVALIAWEKRAPDPLLPISLLAEPSIWRSNLMGACVYGALVGSIAFLPIFLQAVRGLSPGQAGLVLLPLSVGGALGAVIAGRLMLKTGRGMLWPRIGLLVAAAMLVLIGTVAEVAPIWLIPVLLGLTSMGFGTSFPVGQTTVQVAAGSARLGAAAASVQFSRNLGAATGTAILGAVLFGGLALAGGEVAAMFARVIAAPGLVASLPGAEALALREALVGAFRAMFYTAAAFSVVGAVLAARVPLQRI